MLRDPHALFAGGATTTAGLFAGSALYISAVQQPALQRSVLSPSVRVAFFSSIFRRAAPLQASLATLSGTAAVMAGLLQRKDDALTMTSNNQATLWLATGATMIAIVPYTLVAMMKLNQQLLDTEKGSLQHGDAWIDASLKKWARMHGVRTGASLLAFTGMVAALVGGAQDRGRHQVSSMRDSGGDGGLLD
jgi:hypothetical protein